MSRHKNGDLSGVPQTFGISTNNLNTGGLNRAGNGRCQPIDSYDGQGGRPMAASAIRLNTMDHNPTNQKANKVNVIGLV